MGVQIQHEIDLVVKQANLVRRYINKGMTYEQVVHEFLQLANTSDLKQNFVVLEKYIKDGWNVTAHFNKNSKELKKLRSLNDNLNL